MSNSCPNVNQESTHKPTEPTSQTMVTSTQSECGLTVPTVALMVISLVLNGFQAFVIIALLIYIVRKMSKMQAVPKYKDTKEPQIHENAYNNESLYNSIDELAHPDNSKDAPVPESRPKLKNLSNFLAPQRYSGRMPDETVEYMNMK